MKILRNLFVARTKMSVKDTHIGKAFQWAKRRSQVNNVPFDISLEYLRNIATDECPIFKTPFDWGPSGLGIGKGKPNGPQLDRIIPQLGYVEGNVAFISHKANRIKGEGTMQEHYAIADWIWNSTHVKENPTTPISNDDDWKGEIHPQYGFISGTGFRKDDDIIDDTGGAV